MYHNSHQFGKAYQEEMLREAGVKDKHEIEGIIQSQPQGQGLLRRMVSGLFGRKKVAKPTPSLAVREPRRSLSG